MKIKIRSRNDRIEVCDENGNVIPGVTYVEMLPWKKGDEKAKFRIAIEVEAAIVVDGEAEIETVEKKSGEAKVEDAEGASPSAGKPGKAKGGEGRGGGKD